jgi:hypothetical protein
MKLATFVAAVTFAAAPRAAAFTGKVGFAGSSAVLRTASSSSFAARRVLAAVPSTGSFRMLFGGLNPLKKKGVDYEALKDTAKEAATAALAGRVLTKSEAGYEVMHYNKVLELAYICKHSNASDRVLGQHQLGRNFSACAVMKACAFTRVYRSGALV